MEIRAATLSYSAYKVKTNKRIERESLEELDKLEKLLATDPNENTKQQYATAKQELELINNEKNKGCQIRARCLHIESHEYNTKYFLNKEISHAEAKNQQALELDTGEIITEKKEILLEQKKFYEKLYEGINDNNNDNEIEEATNFFLNSDKIKNMVPNDDKDNLDEHITISEVAKAVQALPNGKTPGIDGIPIETYKCFWPTIKELVFKSLTQGLDMGQLSIDQRRGMLTLIPKKVY
jgi:hypothetical protein